MSFSSTNATTPGPGTFGTSEIKSPVDGNILSTQQQQNPAMPTRPKPTIRIRRNPMRMSEQERPESEPNPNGTEPNGEEPETTNC